MIMAKNGIIPDAYSGGFTHNINLEASVYDNSTSGDGFRVPVHVIPVSKLSSFERNKWLLRFRTELEKIRTIQKRVDTAKAHSTNVQANMKKSLGPTKRKPRLEQQAGGYNRDDTRRFQSKKQCEALLKKLMTHRHGWAFNEPVDAVELKIPDYFDVIKNPMDFGTIKEKLSSGKYLNALEFCADVRLTFSNAMTYNPPGNDFHVMANVLSLFFELRWKPIEKKFRLNDSQQQKVCEENDFVKPWKKTKVATIQQNPTPEPVKLAMTDEEKHNLSIELETHLDDLPDNIVEFLREHRSNDNEIGEDEIEIDIDVLNDDTLFKLRKMLDDHVQTKQNHAKAEPCVIELLNEYGLSNSTMQLNEGNDIADEYVDIGGNDYLVSSYPRVEIEKETNEKSNIQLLSGTSSDSDSSIASGDQENAVVSSRSLNLSKEVNVNRADLEDMAGMSDLAETQSISELDQVDQISEQKPNSLESKCQNDDGDSSPNKRHISPKKLYRDAFSKNRSANTNLKARKMTLNQGQKAEFENQKMKENTRLQVEAQAAEDAQRQAEKEAAAKAKRKRDLERAAARQALSKMEKTVEIDETSRSLKDLEILRSMNPEQCRNSVDETSPDDMSPNGLGSFNFRDNNVLEQLGLYMKSDLLEDEDEEGELEPPSVDLDDVVEG